jgi:lysine-specific permease
MLWALAIDGKAPKSFAKLNSRGVPIYSLYVNIAIGFLAFLSSLVGNGTIYTWMLNTVGLSGFIAWLGIAISHYRFRKAYVAQGRDVNDLAYRAKWYPFGPIFSIIICLVVMPGQDYSGFIGGTVDWGSILATYIGIPIFIVLWLGYKFIKKTKVVPLHECDFESVKQ